jgi:uncharacterized protein YbjQ (UPF0145 family)
MPLSASFVADFSSFMTATREAVTALQGFKQSAEQLGPGVDRGLDDTLKMYEQVGRQTRQLALDTVAASKTFITAYAEQQDAVGRLKTALETIGQATPAVVQAYADMAAQFQNTTKYASSAITSAEAVLTTIGKVGPEQMQLALTAVTNLASAMKIDLNTAATIVAKTIASGNEHFGKLAPLLGDAAEKGMSTADMLNAINDKTGPAAQKELQTYNGQMEHLANQLSDFNEKVGKVLVDNLGKILGAFGALPTPIQNFTLAVVAIGTAIAPVLVSLSSLVTMLSGTAIGAGFMTAITAIIGVLTGPVGIGVAAVAVMTAVVLNWDKIIAATQALYEGIKTWLVDRFDAIVAGIRSKLENIAAEFQSLYNTVVGHSIVPDLIDGIGSHFGRLDREMVQPVSEATQAVIAHLQLMQFQMKANAILSRNSLFTTSSQYEDIAALSIPGLGGGAGGGAPVTINNTFNLVDTESNLARRVSDIIMQTVRSGTQLGTA